MSESTRRPKKRTRLAARSSERRINDVFRALGIHDERERERLCDLATLGESSHGLRWRVPRPNATGDTRDDPVDIHRA